MRSAGAAVARLGPDRHFEGGSYRQTFRDLLKANGGARCRCPTPNPVPLGPRGTTPH